MSGSVQVGTAGVISGLQNNQQINAIALALSTMIAGATAPTPANTGLVSTATVWWHDTTNNQIKVRNEADTAWILIGTLDEVNATFAAAATPTNLGKNLIHNSMMRVRQRGTGPWTTLGFVFGVDRWAFGSTHSNGSYSGSSIAFTDAERAVIGDEEADRYLSDTFTGGTGAGDSDIIVQDIEGLRRLSGKTVTVSFWAVALAGTPKIALELTQNFGVGGSSQVNSIGMQAFTLSTTWTRYRATINIPSTAGKTFGTAGTDSLGTLFWLSAGSTFSASRAASIGVQSATIRIWGVQVEQGTQATPLEKQDIRFDLSNCQRYYWQGHNSNTGGTALTGATVTFPLRFPVTMRATPTVSVVTAPTLSNCTSFAVAVNDSESLSYSVVVTSGAATYGIVQDGVISASAEI